MSRSTSEALLQTGWFVISLASQVLVIFIIRSRLPPWVSHPHPALVASSLSVVAVAVALPFTPIGGWFGLVPLPTKVVLALAGVTAAYLFVAAVVKRRFLAWYGLQ